MSPAGSSVAVRDIVVAYGTPRGMVSALTLDAFDATAGESVAIMGPSGCGKSTLLGLLAGLATPSSGSVTMGRTVVSSLTEEARIRFRRHNVGMLYQTDNLLPHLTVEENVGLQLAIAGLVASDGDVGALLDRLGLDAVRTRFPGELSGGQRQRVGVARAVIHRPSIILADEPTGSLDRHNAELVVAALMDRQQELGATLVVVTHDLYIASRIGRIVELRQPRSESGASLAG